MSKFDFGPLPPRFADLKKEIAASIPDFEARATKAWGEILAELDKATKEIAAKGPAVSRSCASSLQMLTVLFDLRTCPRLTSLSSTT